MATINHHRNEHRWTRVRPAMMALLLFVALTTLDTFPESGSESPRHLVRADEVAVTGGLTDRQAAIAHRSLFRFRASGLLMPPEVELILGQPTEKCGGATGFFVPHHDPPEIIVCKPSGTSTESEREQELTLVHELAHLWHWGQGNGEGWFDFSDIVGGVLVSHDSAEWGDRQVERVGVIISWGVFSNSWRSHLAVSSCAGLPGLFRQLTGRNPVAPIPVECANDGTYDPTASGF